MTTPAKIPDELDRSASIVVDCLFKVHMKPGPGLLESIYEVCVAKEITNRGSRVRRQVPVPIVYDGEVLDEGFRIDLLVEEELIVEIKAAEALAPIHTAQVLTYLKLTNKRLALLVNFNTKLIKDGIKRIAR